MYQLIKFCGKIKYLQMILGTCGVNAECRVAIHKAVCTCLNGYEGDPFRQCKPKRPPPPQPPVDKCKPNPCGPYSICTVLGPRPVCECQAGYFGKPPNCQPECLKNSDCALFHILQLHSHPGYQNVSIYLCKMVRNTVLFRLS